MAQWFSTPGFKSKGKEKDKKTLAIQTIFLCELQRKKKKKKPELIKPSNGEASQWKPGLDPRSLNILTSTFSIISKLWKSKKVTQRNVQYNFIILYFVYILIVAVIVSIKGNRLM